MDQTPKKLKILLIEDEEAVREVLFQFLCEVGGHEVVSAHDGRQGCDIFSNDTFDLVITDLGMPGFNGWEVAKKIRETNSKIPIVLATGWGVKLDEWQIRQSRVNLVLEKPFRLDQILDIVNKV